MAQGKICIIGCSICLLLIGLIILLCSISTLEPTEFGLVYNSVTKKMDNVPYRGGWYLIGPT